MLLCILAIVYTVIRHPDWAPKSEKSTWKQRLHATASDALIAANPPEDPSLANTAKAIAVMRVQLERDAANG